MVRASACLLGLMLFCSTSATAQPNVEFWGGLALASPRVESTITTSYVPIIERYSAPLAGSTAGQTVEIRGGGTRGIGGGLNLFLTPRFGFQVVFDTDRFDVTGTNGNYSVLLNYTAMQPPDYVERSYSSSSTFTACGAAPTAGCVQPTAGSLRQTSLGFNLVGRWPAGGRVNLEVSGGLSYVDVRGDARPLRYTVFEMGGHSTLFSQEYQLAYSVGPAHGLGVNAGGTLDIRLGRSLAVTADARLVTGREVSAPVRITDVVNKEEVSFLQDAATIQQGLQPPPFSISPVQVRLLVGLKVLR